jgi:ribonuclease HI
LFDCLENLADSGRSLLLMVLWRNWFSHNEIMHGKPVPTIEASKNFLLSYVNTLLEIKQHPQVNQMKGKHVINYWGLKKDSQQRLYNGSTTDWEKPQQGWMKVNVDGSYDAQTGTGGIEVVLRDSEGNVIAASCKQLASCRNALEAELLPCKEGAVLALQWTFLPFVLETDCLVAIQMIQSKEKDISELAYLIREVKELLGSNRKVKICKALRSQNWVGHSLANKVRCDSLSGLWTRNGCNFISRLVYEDAVSK